MTIGDILILFIEFSYHITLIAFYFGYFLVKRRENDLLIYPDFSCVDDSYHEMAYPYTANSNLYTTYATPSRPPVTRAGQSQVPTVQSEDRTGPSQDPGPSQSPIAPVTVPIATSQRHDGPSQGPIESSQVPVAPVQVPVWMSQPPAGPSQVTTRPSQVHTGPPQVHTGPSQVHTGPLRSAPIGPQFIQNQSLRTDDSTHWLSPLKRMGQWFQSSKAEQHPPERFQRPKSYSLTDPGHSLRISGPVMDITGGRGKEEESWVSRALRRYANIENMPKMPAFLVKSPPKRSKNEPLYATPRSRRILKVIAQPSLPSTQQTTLTVTGTLPVLRRVTNDQSGNRFDQDPLKRDQTQYSGGRIQQNTIFRRTTMDTGVPRPKFCNSGRFNFRSSTPDLTFDASAGGSGNKSPFTTAFLKPSHSPVLVPPATAPSVHMHMPGPEPGMVPATTKTIPGGSGDTSIPKSPDGPSGPSDSGSTDGPSDLSNPGPLNGPARSMPKPAPTAPLILIHEDKTSPETHPVEAENVDEPGKAHFSYLALPKAGQPVHSVNTIIAPDPPGFIQDEIWSLPIPRGDVVSDGKAGWQMASREETAKLEPVEAQILPQLSVEEKTTAAAAGKEPAQLLPAQTTSEGTVSTGQHKIGSMMIVPEPRLQSVSAERTGPHPPSASEEKAGRHPRSVSAERTGPHPPSVSAEKAPVWSERMPTVSGVVQQWTAPTGTRTEKETGKERTRKMQEDRINEEVISKIMDMSRRHLFDDSIAEKVRACQTIVHELKSSSDTSSGPQSRAQRMFSKRKQRFAQYPLCSAPGPEICPENDGRHGQNGVNGQRRENGDQTKLAKLVQNVRGGGQQGYGEQTSATNLDSSERCQRLSQALKTHMATGKGADMFARKRQEAENWTGNERSRTPASQRGFFPSPAVDKPTTKQTESTPAQKYGSASLPPIPTPMDSLRPFRRELESISSPIPLREWASHDRHERLFSPTPFTNRVRAPSVERVPFSPPRPYTPLVFSEPSRSRTSSVASSDKPSREPFGVRNFPLAWAPSTGSSGECTILQRVNSFNTLPRSWRSYLEAYQNRSSTENLGPM